MSQSHLEIEPTDAYDTTNWVGLFGAEVAASAALTGLIFVAVSINLQRILAFPSLPRRGGMILIVVQDVGTVCHEG